MNNTIALTTIDNRTTQGLNQQRPCERTILVALDLSKALVQLATPHLNNLRRRIVNYLRGLSRSLVTKDQKPVDINKEFFTIVAIIIQTAKILLTYAEW